MECRKEWIANKTDISPRIGIQSFKTFQRTCMDFTWTCSKKSHGKLKKIKFYNDSAVLSHYIKKLKGNIKKRHQAKYSVINLLYSSVPYTRILTEIKLARGTMKPWQFFNLDTTLSILIFKYCFSSNKYFQVLLCQSLVIAYGWQMGQTARWAFSARHVPNTARVSLAVPGARAGIARALGTAQPARARHVSFFLNQLREPLGG